ncbi:alpha/beta hydrolase family protein [Pseudonocardia hierapolitana]|uniref:Alpha/beta hydrolase family protein n=1 Tax=Pseudonocardia hierapolitana TaxID=1128676 RepID=A0A561SUN1_9PSEU|nr:alpha/beta hydrolase fold domain-containing protein [Pseudonocardia hierapolitana]TWF78564.1 alpha/beta hydrolase family protein [Pseudonocardia hierapolitana]
MTDVMSAERLPLGIRLLQALRKEPDWSAMTEEDLAAFRDAENRRRASRLIRVITGLPDRSATIRWQEVALPDRTVRVRVYRPSPGPAALPLVLHVHGGGFVGTAVQSDWVNSHLAARLPALVVSVEHRLLDARTPLAAAVDDGWDVLRQVVRHGTEWGADPIAPPSSARARAGWSRRSPRSGPGIPACPSGRRCSSTPLSISPTR